MRSGSWLRPRRERSTADPTEAIASPRNPRVAAAIRLQRGRRRRETAEALLEGPHAIVEAMRAGAVITTFFALDGDPIAEQLANATCDIVFVTRPVLERLAPTATPRGPVAIVAIPSDEIPPVGDLLVAWGVGDPGNVGTLIRTAAAFGLGFAAGPDCADPWSPKTLRSAAGAHFLTSVGRAAEPAELAGDGRLIVATVPRGGDPPASLPNDLDLAVLVGDEALGLPMDIVQAADRIVTIPMPGGTESLNAGVVGAILAYEVGLLRRLS